MQTDRLPILSTVGLPEDPPWQGLMEAAHPIEGHPGRSLIELFRASRGRRALVLRGSVSLHEWYRDLLFALVLRHRTDRPRTLMTDAMWEPTSRKLSAVMPWAEPLLPHIARGVIRAIDGPHLRYAVLSEAEREVFSRTWGVPLERVVFTPFPMTLYDEHDDETTRGDYVFAGGNSLRDYDLLADAVRGTGIRVRVAADWSPSTPTPEIDAGRVSHERFVELLIGCRAMVLPLQPSVRSAGQQTFLNAMVLGKPVIVTDGLGVRDYIDDGVTGVVVEPTVPAVRAALQHVCDPSNDAYYEAMGRAAREAVQSRFMPHNYVESIMAALGHPDPEGGRR